MANNLDEKDWQILLGRIAAGKCTPFLGAGVGVPHLPLGSEIAQEWAKEYDYPLNDSSDLARVSQFLAISRDYMFPKEKMAERVRGVKPPVFSQADEPHAVLARLPLPLYLTTNYDDFMVKALQSVGKDPKRELCRWNKYVKSEASVFRSRSGFTPTEANPVVFHLHGHADVSESLVLTEDDYLDFLVNISKDEHLVPLRIRSAFAGTSLLFIGYRMADWNFRVLFRSLVSSLEKTLTRAHVSVQIAPGGGTATRAQQEKAQDYLNRYFNKLEVRIYWGTSREFAAELDQRWRGFTPRPPGPVPRPRGQVP